ncbi:MAG TPA: efflux RND transporter periplasmic adaptor subunit [Opitutaceae bacterium]|nr:efflux RND transporter periplasmic adaptor subunit [Opitutaceae bacterium]
MTESGPSGRGRAPLSSRAQIRIVGLAALAILAVVASTQILPHLFAPREKAAEAPPPPGYFRPTEEQWASLAVAAVTEMRFQSAVTTDGKVAFDDDLMTPVFSPYSGRVTKLFAKAGDSVAKGQPLLAIAGSEFVQAQNDLISAGAALDLATAQLALARTNEQRQEALYQARGAALKDLLQARVDRASAESGLRTAEIALAAVRNRLRILGRSDEEIDELAKSRQVAMLTPEVLVTAPIAGTVTQRQVGLGQNIVSAASGGSTAVFMIGNLTKVWLRAEVREADAPAMRVGEPVEARVLAYPGRVFRGRLDFVAPALDSATHRLFVHAEVENPGDALKPEMFADFRIFTAPDVAAPAVPEAAVIYEGPEARVWVARADRALGLRPIRAGRVQEGMVEVLSGLAAGESVVTSGSLFIDRAAHSQ